MINHPLVLPNDSSNRLENDFDVSMRTEHLPIAFSPIRIDHCMICICLSGSSNIEIDLRHYTYVENDIFIAFPGQILASNEQTDDFAIAFISFSNRFMDEILFRLPSTFIGFLKESVVYHLPKAERESMISEYFVALERKFIDYENICRTEIIKNLLQNFYLDLYNKVVKNNDIDTRQPKRKKELEERFFRLIKEHPKQRDVAFFAEKLCITPKYLSIITKETTGVSAKELIDNYAITELKLQLKSTSLTIKEIAYSLNYPNEAFLCKYFKKRTLMTPTHYRKWSK